MKHLFLFTALLVSGMLSQAANVDISISGFAFSPNAPTVNVGDVITWTNHDPFNHRIEFTSVPATAAGGLEPIIAQNGTFQYTVTVAGSYSYRCGIHTTSMFGSFTATSTTPVIKPASILTQMYPNPALETVHIESSQTIKSVEIYSETGVLLKTLSYSSDKIDIPSGDLSKGIYFLKVIGLNAEFETRRLIKD